MSEQKPWLDKKNWAENNIYSSARHGHWVIWGFALFWNLVTLPLFLQFGEIWDKIQREPITALVFLFPLVGLFLIGLAVTATRQKQRFGLTPLVMDPFPGSLGGQVGGRVETGIPFDLQQHFQVSLSCIHSKVSKSGKNKTRSESVKWHAQGVCHSEPARVGTRLQFRFDVPAELPHSEPRGRSYHLWRLRVHTELPGIDFDRSFEIPVFDTQKQSSGIEESTDDHPATVDAAMAGLESVADITPVPGGIQARFPALQRPGMGIFMVVFGVIFAAVGIFVGTQGGVGYLFLVVFGLLGTLIAMGGLFYLGKSLLVAVTRDELRARRFFFGYPITTRQLPAAAVRRLEIRQAGTLQSGKKTTVFYQLYAHGGGKSRAFPVAERLNGRPEAELLRETYLTYLGKESG